MCRASYKYITKRYSFFSRYVWLLGMGSCDDVSRLSLNVLILTPPARWFGFSPSASTCFVWWKAGSWRRMNETRLMNWKFNVIACVDFFCLSSIAQSDDFRLNSRKLSKQKLSLVALRCPLRSYTIILKFKFLFQNAAISNDHYQLPSATTWTIAKKAPTFFMSWWLSRAQ